MTNVSKAHELDADKLAAVSDPYTALSLRLHEAFRLRREKSIKLRPTWADRGDVLHLKASWTKGGKERDIPIRTEEQRELLQEAKQLAGAGRYRSRSWTTAPLRADALCGPDGLEVPGCGWADLEAAERGAEGDRQASSADDLARAGARARVNNSGLSGAVRCPLFRLRPPSDRRKT